MQSPFAYEPVPEIEKTFRTRSKKQRLKKRRKAREESPKMDAGARGQRETLRDFITLGDQGISSSIARPIVEVNNFELRPTVISVVQQSQFGGSPMNYPNLHLSIFLEVCDTLKLNRVSTDAICLRIFLFSLKDKARAWLHSLSPDSIRTWDKITIAFLAKFFPPSKTTSQRNQITTSPKERMNHSMKLGAVQEFLTVVPSSWTSEVDDHPNLLQRGLNVCGLQ